MGAAYTDPVTGMEFVLVEGGCYQMGYASGDDDGPVHEVCVDDLWLGKYEVTQGQWLAIMGYNLSKFPGDRRPMDQVSWESAQAFIGQLSQQSGKAYRLPTAAEWAYAARSGGKREKWAGTSSEAELGEYAWYETNSGNGTHVVGTRRPNGLGLYDMNGNVWEWVQDRYESPRNNPQGPRTDTTVRMLRGGAWDSTAEMVRATLLHEDHPSSPLGSYGFRLAMSAR
jgi:formylglycine-generating enzyme required for sulfatase activity